MRSGVYACWWRALVVRLVVAAVVVSVLIVFRASLMCLAEGVHFLLQGLEVGIKNGEFQLC